MKQHLFPLFLLVFCCTAFAQVYEIPDSVFRKYVIKPGDDLMHFGDGELSASVFINYIWIRVKFEKILFHRHDSTLYLSGTVMNDLSHPPTVYNFELRLGHYIVTDTVPRIRGRFITRELYDFDGTCDIYVLLKITPEDEICIDLPELKIEDRVLSERFGIGTKSFVSARVEMYKVGELFKDYGGESK